METASQTLLYLALGAEKAAPKDQRAVLVEVYDTLYPVDGSGPSREFFTFLDAGAYDSAASFLLPEDWDRIDEQQTRQGAYCRVTLNVNGFSPKGEGRAVTSALARLAAILRAHEQATRLRALNDYPNID